MDSLPHLDAHRLADRARVLARPAQAGLDRRGLIPVPGEVVLPSDQHVTLGWGRDHDDVSPVKGVTVGGGDQRVSVSVEVLPA